MVDQPVSENVTGGKSWPRFRLSVRCCGFVIALVLASSVLPWPWTPLILPSLSPHVLIGAAIAGRAVGVTTLIGLPVLLLVILRRRWFCRYACPLGLVAEYAGRVGFRRKSTARGLPPVGRWVVLCTLGGALFGYPFFLWLDPMAIFQGAAGLWQDPSGPAGRVSAVVLGVILVIGLIRPGAWCMRLCPAGATQELLSLPLGSWRTPASEDEVTNDGGQRLPRRVALSTIAATACVGLGAGWAWAASRFSPRRRRGPLRPPGAVDEGLFDGLCIRCGNCLRGCPSGIIQAADVSEGVAGFLTPRISFAEGYCREDCHRCTQVCPSGAIARLSLEAKNKAPIGIAKVEPEICLLWDDGECGICKPACPHQAITMIWSEEEYISLPKVDADKCPGCGACQLICPATNQWEREHSEQPVAERKAIEVR
jgi:ferredoxin-type protein NapF